MFLGLVFPLQEQGRELARKLLADLSFLKTVLEENSKGSWHGWEVSRKGPVNDMGVYNQAKVFAESINKGDVIVKHSQDEGDNPPF